MDENHIDNINREDRENVSDIGIHEPYNGNDEMTSEYDKENYEKTQEL